MTEEGNLEERVTALEGEVGDLEHRLQRSEKDAAAARVLAGGADRDTSELRIELREFGEQNMRLHNATRADIADIRGELGQLNGRVDTLTLEIRSKFDILAAGQHQIVELISRADVDKGGDS